MTSGTGVPQTLRKSKTKKDNSFHADGRDGKIPSPALSNSTKATVPSMGTPGISYPWDFLSAGLCLPGHLTANVCLSQNSAIRF